MKTERRHELQHNELSDHMGVLLERIRPYSAGIAISIIAIVVALMLYSFWQGQQQTQNAEAWEAYFAATQSIVPDLEKLEQVSTQFPREDVGLWARIMLADHQLAEGTEDLFRDRAKARTNLAKAVENYDHVHSNTRDDALRERADIGLARAYEAQGDLEKARQRYQVLLQNSPNGPFGMLARERLDDLEKEPAKEFYDWFGKEEPKPVSTGAPATGDPLDFDFSKLPESPAGAGGSMLQLPGFPIEGGVSTPTQPAPGEAPAASPSESPAVPADKAVAPTGAATPAAEAPAPAPAPSAEAPAETPKAEAPSAGESTPAAPQ
jgi:predicted negative regulator of RcsB-dependent stress response